MYILPTENSISMQGGGPISWFGQKILNKFPEHTKKETDRTLKRMQRFDDISSHPAWNRAIMGATAICTQPFFDKYNHRVDEETRAVSTNRTIAKICVGTLVGIMVRGSIYKLAEKMTDIKGKAKYSHALLPKKYMAEIAKNEKFLKNYRSTLAMSLALAAMCFTNFLIDAPLTIFFTNLLNDRRNKQKQKLQKEAKNG